jgi:uncharacterized protein involved in exopolysaccharide biosynthesis
MKRPEASPGEAGAEGFIDAPRLMRELARRKFSIILPTALAAGAALAFVMVIAPRYTGVAKVVLVNQESYFTKPDKATGDVEQALDDEAVQSAAESLTTPDIAQKAIDALGLGARAEFHPSGVEAIVSALVGGSRGNGGDIVVETFLNHTTVFPVARSRVIQIEFQSEDPALAARGANTLAALFLDSRSDAKKAEAKAAAAWLGSRIEPLRAKVAEDERSLEAFRSSSGLLTGANGLTTPSQRLSELTSQVASARAAQSAAAARAQNLRDLLRTGRLDAIADATHDDSLRRYAETRVTLKAQIAELSRTYLPGHPRMKELEGQLSGLDDEMRAAATKTVRGYEDEARIASDQVRNLESAIADQSRIVSSGDADTVKLQALELEAKTAREQLESYIDKYHEAVARQSDDAGPANARIIETAAPPSAPSFPKRAPTILLAALAGFVLSLGVAAARVLLSEGEIVERAVTPRPSPVEAPAAAAPVLAPEAIAAEPPATLDNDAPKTESDLEAAVAALVETTPQGPLTLLVTGEGSRGALGVALMVARRLSLRASTVLIDLGMTQPWLSDVVERDSGSVQGFLGLGDLVANVAGFEDVLHRDLSSRIDIIPPGREEVAPEDLETILAALAESYDFVIVHVSDWRVAVGRAALERAHGAIVCALKPRLGPMRERIQWAVGERRFLMAEIPMQKRDSTVRAA